MSLTSRELLQLIPQAMIKDRHPLQRKLRQLKGEDQQQLQSLENSLLSSIEAVKNRQLNLPEISYPEALPVSQERLAITQAIRDNQVVIIAGETGSGKTTQIPKMCLELGLGNYATIGHTQPRRLAARSVAQRIADELQTDLGSLVGYKVRFNDKIQADSQVKLMTDGILLAELQNDRYLNQYSVIIIDEAHERSLNIDFILGYLKQLLVRRKDLKVIVTSATIDPERFSQHFENAPILEVSGRTFPVETRYRPLKQDQQDRDLFEGIKSAVDELDNELEGDILVFMNGEREIRDCADYLNKQNFRNTEVLPLFSRLSNAEQNRIFNSHSQRRIVLATNVAETSVTVPGIRYVIDPGTARISRYSHRSKVQRLPIEAISQASANQRMGRCGRLSDGICIRLYEQEDFDLRPEFTDPEILRTNLASVILQMTSLRLGKVADFPFVQAPDQRNIKDGYDLLEELAAIDENDQQKLTNIGRAISRLPLDPRLARMVVAARDFDCVDEVIVIVAGLTIQDPRERPLDKQQASDEMHRRFFDENSDFAAYLNLWRYLQKLRKEISESAFRKRCKKEFLAYMRVREWQDLATQIRQQVRELGYPLHQREPDFDAIHQALTTGLLSHIGFKDKEREFLGARNRRFVVFPGSGLAKKPPKWLVAAELTETSRLFARTVAKIQPQWLEALASHRTHSRFDEPHWSKKRLSVMAYETVTLYGLTIISKRLVNYATIDPAMARTIFIRSALVEGEWNCKHSFYKENQALLDDVEALEHKSRRRDIRIDDQQLYDFYDKRLPESIVSARHFDKWWKKQGQNDKDFLSFSRQELMRHDAKHVTNKEYPNTWSSDGIELKLSYQFEPGKIDDGVSVSIPLPLLNQIDASQFKWQIPALREELAIALIKSLPKYLRRNFVPAPNFAQAALANMSPSDGDFVETFSKHLLRMTGVRIDAELWDWQQVPAHLRINFNIIDAKYKTITQGRDYANLQQQLSGKVEESIQQAAPNKGLERQGLTTWDFESLPQLIEQKRQGYTIKAYPALSDDKKSVSIKLFDDQETAAQSQHQALIRLLEIDCPAPLKYLQQKLPNRAKLGLYYNPFGKVEQLIQDCIRCAILEIVGEQVVQSQSQYTQIKDDVNQQLAQQSLDVVNAIEPLLSQHYALKKKLKGKVPLEWILGHKDISAQLEALVHPGFVSQSGLSSLKHIQRYLLAIEKRLEKLPVDPQRDRLAQQQIQSCENDYLALKNKFPEPKYAKQIQAVFWAIQELRVSLFAQQLGTQYPVSAKRVSKQISELDKALVG
ncbi:ATP-dependent RNA helicase HrpA [Alginatibacterium sediminis]|uniref:RNA helicase n=1 Tax=Alginatibacterium sediminis TaxID=2164068 RepID=A0A420EHL9_9ALTE|nr:ATP-dependent RNA helicase HrpA [Alginatibacterium sediminis]RKF20160.1 ATP-dependent RNA helicase HrpA [Alginatibacterium sediminis]